MQKFLIVICSIAIIFVLFAVLRNQTNTTNSVNQDTTDSPSQITESTASLLKLTDEDTITLQIDQKDVSLEVATSPEKHARGLMFRETLAENTGMLFIFDAQRPLSFWMQNTLVPLDIIFIDNTLSIVKIHENTRIDQIVETYSSEKPAQFVIELPGGNAATLGLVEGLSLKQNFDAFFDR